MIRVVELEISNNEVNHSHKESHNKLISESKEE